MRAFKLSDEYAAEWTSRKDLYIFAYFEDGGEIRPRPHGGHLTLGEAELRALAEEACANYGGCDFLEAAEKKAQSVPVLLEALEETLARLCYCCRRLNPQHAECTWCPDTEQARAALAGAQANRREQSDVQDRATS